MNPEPFLSWFETWLFVLYDRKNSHISLITFTEIWEKRVKDFCFCHPPQNTVWMFHFAASWCYSFRAIWVTFLKYLDVPPKVHQRPGLCKRVELSGQWLTAVSAKKLCRCVWMESITFWMNHSLSRQTDTHTDRQKYFMYDQLPRSTYSLQTRTVLLRQR